MGTHSRMFCLSHCVAVLPLSPLLLYACDIFAPKHFPRRKSLQCRSQGKAWFLILTFFDDLARRGPKVHAGPNVASVGFPLFQFSMNYYRNVTTDAYDSEALPALVLGIILWNRFVE